MAETICERVAQDFPGLAECMREREALGLARYGVPLDPFDGRDWLAEAREELADAIVYLTAAQRRLSNDDQDSVRLATWVRIVRARRAIADALADLERV